MQLSAYLRWRAVQRLEVRSHRHSLAFPWQPSTQLAMVASLKA